MIRSIAFLPRRLRGGTAVVRGLPCVSACVWVAGPRSQGFVWVHSALSEGTSPLLSRWCVAAASPGLSPPSVAHSNMNELQSGKKHPAPERMVHEAVDPAHRWVSENTVRNIVEAEICLELFKRC
jgi:hypothetical protein